MHMTEHPTRPGWTHAVARFREFMAPYDDAVEPPEGAARPVLGRVLRRENIRCASSFVRVDLVEGRSTAVVGALRVWPHGDVVLHPHSAAELARAFDELAKSLFAAHRKETRE